MSATTGATGVRWACAAIAAAMLAGTLAMTTSNPYTTVVAEPGIAWLAALAPVGVLVAASVHADPRRGLLLAIAALAWPVGEWAGWSGGPAWARAIAAGAIMVTPLAAVEVAGAVTARPRRSPLGRVLVAAGVGVAVLGFVDRALLLDPFDDPDCWRSCVANPLALSAPDIVDRGVRWVSTGAALAVVVGAGVATLAAVARAARVGRRGAVGALQAVGAAALLAAAGAGVAGMARAALGLGVAAGLVLILAAVAQLARRLRARAALAVLIDDLAGAPADGALEESLARSLGDPDLRVVYWSPERQTFLTATGRAADARPRPGLGATPVHRGSEQVAVVLHRPGIDPADIEQAFRPAARLWLDNERLRAETRAELADLQASEARLAARSAEERRRIERDLHDGAQQRVVGIALLLRMLRGRLGDPAAPAAERARHTGELLDDLLATLRQIAHGGDRDQPGASS